MSKSKQLIEWHRCDVHYGALRHLQHAVLDAGFYVARFSYHRCLRSFGLARNLEPYTIKSANAGPTRWSCEMNARICSALSMIVALSVVGPVNADSKVRVDKADVDLGMCRTFSWQPQSAGIESLTDQRVRALVMATLAAKGYTQDTEHPDCRIAYTFTLTQANTRSGPSVGVGVGGGSGSIGGGVGVRLPMFRKKHAGTITIDIIDATKNAQIWSGALDSTFKADEMSEAEARNVVSKVLAKYPDRK